MEWLKAHYCHDDFLTTIAVLGLIGCAITHAASVDLSSFGMGVAAIFGGHAARSFGNKQEPPQ